MAASDAFVNQINAESGGAPIVAAIIGMARSLKLRVVAEGVESGAQLAFLQGLGCEQAQGYYFCRPVPADDFVRYVQLRSSSPGSAIALA